MEKKGTKGALIFFVFMASSAQFRLKGCRSGGRGSPGDGGGVVGRAGGVGRKRDASEINTGVPR